MYKLFLRGGGDSDSSSSSSDNDKDYDDTSSQEQGNAGEDTADSGGAGYGNDD